MFLTLSWFQPYGTDLCWPVERIYFLIRHQRKMRDLVPAMVGTLTVPSSASDSENWDPLFSRVLGREQVSLKSLWPRKTLELKFQTKQREATGNPFNFLDSNQAALIWEDNADFPLSGGKLQICCATIVAHVFMDKEWLWKNMTQTKEEQNEHNYSHTRKIWS